LESYNERKIWIAIHSPTANNFSENFFSGNKFHWPWTTDFKQRKHNEKQQMPIQNKFLFHEYYAKTPKE